MAKTIGRNSNTSDTATIIAGITMNTSTSVKILDSNVDRINATISNKGPGSVFIKLQATSVDDVAKGILLESGDVYEMTPDNIYTGEISGIAVTNNPVVYPMEY